MLACLLSLEGTVGTEVVFYSGTKRSSLCRNHPTLSACAYSRHECASQ